MADVSIDIELVTRAFNQALKEAGVSVDQFELKVGKAQKGVNTSFKKIDKQAKDSNKGFSLLNGTIGSFLGNLSAGIVFKFADSLASLARGLKNVAIEATNAAIDAEETRSKFDAVFSDISDAADKTAQDLSKSFGLGAVEAERLLSATGDLLSGFGFTQESALDLSNQVQELAVDLASFSNFSGGAEGASEALTKALLGERESVKALGISIQEKDVIEQVAINRAKGLVFETERQAKAQATLDIAIRQSQNAIGDYARTSDSAANQSRLFGTRIQDLKEEIGQAFIPVVKAGFQQINAFLASLDTDKIRTFIADGIQRIIPVIAEIASVSVSAFNVLLASIDAVILGFDGLKFIFSATFTVALSAAESVVNLAQSLLALTGADPSPTLQNAAKNIASLKEISSESTAEIQENIKARINAREQEGKALQEFGSDLENSLNKLTEVELSKTAIVKAAAQERTQAAIEEESRKNQLLDELKAARTEEENVIKAELEIAQEEDELKKIQKVLENEQRKIKIVRDAELEKAKLVEGEAQKAAARQAAINKAELGVLRAQNKAKISTEKELANRQEKNYQARLTATQGFLTAGISLAKQGSREQKALQIANATVNTYAAGVRAMTDYPYPANLAVLASTIAVGLANVAKISSAGSFQDGGIVPGASFSGDNLQANVNSGELILNRGQQQRLLSIANGQSTNLSGGINAEEVMNIVQSTVANMQVVMVADDREIARSVSNGVDQGIIIGAS